MRLKIVMLMDIWDKIPLSQFFLWIIPTLAAKGDYYVWFFY